MINVKLSCCKHLTVRTVDAYGTSADLNLTVNVCDIFNYTVVRLSEISIVCRFTN